jgi:hypothetical protein
MRVNFDTIYTFFKRVPPQREMLEYVLARPFAGPQIYFRGYGAGTFQGTPRIATRPLGFPVVQSLVTNDIRGYGASNTDASITSQPLIQKPNYSDL